MSALRKAVRNKPCLVRLHGICNNDWSTTILAHLRIGGVTGVGMKPHDLMAVQACSACHEEIGDGKSKYAWELLLAVARTIHQRSQEGTFVWKSL